ncbi:hypothetical protein ACHMW6_14710 [Pseudoduganella sp. UC29_106]|uniref:hypothetical protein n=1 Tax=Pseudoduganella sp. UC29_106 TaxID=3374553 RepID=UPI0037566F24
MRSGCFKVNSVAHLQRGAGRLEFAVVVAVLGVLMTVFLQRVQFYQAEAEQAAMQTVVAQLRTALAVKVGARYLRGENQKLSLLAEENPMTWLERLPPNYAGEYDGAKPGNLLSGHWYFDSHSKTLTYLLNKRNYFFPETQNRHNFKLEFRRTEGILTNSHATPEAGGLSLEQID